MKHLKNIASMADQSQRTREFLQLVRCLLAGRGRLEQVGGWSKVEYFVA